MTKPDDTQPLYDPTQTTAPQSTQPLPSITNYKLLDMLGEGGFGVVYLAQQTKPVKRKVAIKVIKPGMDSKAVIARFEAERQALAMMNHPNVAKVFDAGTTQQGRPYFVMELVTGVPITEHCDRHKLNIVERLNLFIDVCEAVQHAHQKGIIHRDIKPSNILVEYRNDVSIIKVIDFGVAKAIEQKLSEQTIFTQQGQLIGTPAYMSPEQAEMTAQDIDTRSDIYSLGVVLYQLLTGVTPFDTKTLLQAGWDEIRRVIREQEPQKPSTKLSSIGDELDTDSATIAHNRKTNPNTLTKHLRGDLDWIAIKALEKDRTRRYATATEFADDLRRHLRYEPVLASPPSSGYRFKKFIRRNKGPVTAVVAVLLSLAVGLALAVHLYIEAENARAETVVQRDHAKREAERARTEAAKSAQVATFLSDMLRGVGPSVALGRDTTLLREILDKTAERVGEELLDQPEVEAEIRLSLGDTYRVLGDYETANRHLTKAVEICRTLHGTEREDVATSLYYLGILRESQGDYAQAGDLFERALALRRKLLGSRHESVALVLNRLGVIQRTTGDYKKAESTLREALSIRRERFGPDHLEVASSLSALAGLFIDWARLDEAKQLFEQALDIQRQHSDIDGTSVCASLEQLAQILMQQGDFEAAETRAREAMSLSRKLYGKEHPWFASALQTVAVTVHRRGRYAEAETLQREVLRIRRKTLGNDHPSVASSLILLARTLADLGEVETREPLLREALDIDRNTFGENHVQFASALSTLADLLRDRGEYKEAELLYKKALTITRAKLGDEHLNVSRILNNLGMIYQDQAEYASAEKIFRETLAIDQRVFGEDSPSIANALNNLAATLRSQEKYTEAEPLQRQSLAMDQQTLGTNHPLTAAGMNNLARTLFNTGRLKEAAELYQGAVEIVRKSLPPGHWYIGAFQGNYGECLTKMERFEDAEKQLMAAHDILEKKLGANHNRTQMVVDFLVVFYEDRNNAEPGKGYDAKAAEWRAKLTKPEPASKTNDH